MLAGCSETSAMRFASLEMVLSPDGPHPPEVSATMGTKLMPCDAHTSAVLRNVRFTSSYWTAAAPAVQAAHATTSARCGEATARSNAAGTPPSHVGIYTSAGRRRLRPVAFLESSGLGGKRSAFSRSGPKPAAAADRYTAFLAALCRCTRSPRQAHILAW